MRMSIPSVNTKLFGEIKVFLITLVSLIIYPQDNFSGVESLKPSSKK